MGDEDLGAVETPTGTFPNRPGPSAGRIGAGPGFRKPESPQDPSLRQIETETGIPRSTAHRWLQILVSRGMATSIPYKGYVIHPGTTRDVIERVRLRKEMGR